MSTYEDYDDAAAYYDATRVAVGVPIILGHLVTGPAPLADTHLLDAGCGTGSFAVALAPHVGRITLVDASEGMLAVAEAKLAAMDGAPPHEARQATLQDLPFDDATFDAVMTNQVLHHLGDEDADGWPEHQRAMAEYARVLRPGGVLTINTCAHEQIRHGYWPMRLVPRGAEEMCRRYAPLEVVEGLARDVGLEVTGRFVPVDATIQSEDYFDPEGPLSEEWRRTDSVWTLVDDAELEAMTETLERLRGSEAEELVAELDARRLDVGQVTFLAFRKPAE